MDRNQTIEHLWDVIRFALTGEPQTLTAETVEAVWPLAKRHQMLHLLAYAAEKQRIPLPEERRKLLRRAMKTQMWVQAQQDLQLSCIERKLAEEKIAYIPLKGAVLKQFYPASWMRFSADLDLLVHMEDLEAAAISLQAIGYTLVRKGSHCWELAAENGKVHLELHYRLINRIQLPQAAALLDTVWSTAAAETDFRYRMSPEFFCLFHLAHMAVHIFKGGCGLRPFADLWLLQRNLPMDSQRLTELLEQSGLADFYRTVSQMAENWVSGAYDQIPEAAAEFVAAGGVFGTAKAAQAMTQAKTGGKLKTIFHRIFLTVPEMKYRYPVLNRFPILLPWCFLRYWWWVIRSGKLRSGQRILQQNLQVPTERLESAQNVLQAFGLQGSAENH